MQRTLRIWLAALALSSAPQAQESEQPVERPGSFSKHLTPDQADAWSLAGQRDETILAYVSSEEFDPTMRLLDPNGQVLAEADDPGSESWLGFHLPEAGGYTIQVRAFEGRGGGNYELTLRRFTAVELQPGTPASGVFDQDGKLYGRVQAEAGRTLTLETHSVRQWSLLDPRGRPVEGWEESALVRLGGEQILELEGEPGTRASVCARAAQELALAQDQPISGALDRFQMDVYTLAAKAGDFRVISLERNAALLSRLVEAFDPARARPELEGAEPEPSPFQFLPIESKGSRVRYAVLFQKPGAYRLELLGRGAAAYQLKMSDPTIQLQPGERSDGLEIGGAAFYTIGDAMAGQLFELGVSSDGFDPTLRLYAPDGRLMAENDDGADGLGSRLAWICRLPGVYRAQVASRGNGGGGAFTLKLERKLIPALTLGQAAHGSLGGSGMDVWGFEARAGQAVILQTSSATCDTALEVYGPDGVRVAATEGGGLDDDAMLAVRFDQPGLHTVAVLSRSGTGGYTLRPLDAE